MNSTCTSAAAIFAYLWLAMVAIAGPQKDARPLTMGPEAAADPQPERDDNRAYYWSGGRKVFLNETGLAVAQLKEGVDPEKQLLSFSAAALSATDPLSELAPRLREARIVIVSTEGGPGALDLRRASANPPESVQFVLPILEPETARGSQTQPATKPADDPDAWRSQLIMTPRISAEFDPSMNQDQVAQYVRAVGLKVARKQEYVPNGYVLELAEGRITYERLLAAANQLYERGTAEKKIVYAHPTFIPTKRKYQTATDPNFKNQWHLRNTGQGGGTAGADAKVFEAWQITEGRPDIVIGIIDDSIQKGHPDLRVNYKSGRYYDGVTGTATDDPSPKSGKQRHGTSCAGVAAADANDICGRGAAPRCKIVAVNFWDGDTAQTAEAFHFCAAEGAAVISCSWSWGAAFDDVSRAIERVAREGRNGKGVVILFAAGNEYGLIAANQEFASLRSVICVGATNWRDDHSPYSNYGPELCVVAPSSDIDTPGALGISTLDNTDNMPRLSGRAFSGYSSGDCTPDFGGTSSATPLVAGVCALMLSVNPDFTAAQVRAILEETADKIPGVLRTASYNGNDRWGQPNHDVYYGHGRVNARRAVERARQLAQPGSGGNEPVHEK